MACSGRSGSGGRPGWESPRAHRGGRGAAAKHGRGWGGFFPADAPHLGVVMKTDNPEKGSSWGAQGGARVPRSMLERAPAARTVALDRARLSNVAPTADRAPLDAP